MEVVIRGTVRTGRETLDTAITDLEYVEGPSGPLLVSASGPEGGIASYAPQPDRLPRAIDRAFHVTGQVSGAGHDVVILPAGNDGFLVHVSGVMRDGIVSYTMTATGRFGDRTNVGGASFGAAPSVVAFLPSGRVGLADPGQSGFGVYSFVDETSLGSGIEIEDTAGTHADMVGAMAAVRIGGSEFVIVASQTEYGVTAYRVQSARLVPTGTVGPADGLGIMVPTDIAVAETPTGTFLIIASEPSRGESGALSVMQIDAQGQLIPVDHVLDTHQSRFGKVQHVETVTHEGHTYVVAAGGDGGVSVFELMPNGRLVHLVSVESTPAVDLDDVTALEVAVIGDELQVFVASEGEEGVIVLGADLADQGEAIVAPDGGNTIKGTARDDILVDGQGADRLDGGAGSDRFVMTSDGQVDTIVGFDPSEDVLDLSGLPFLYDVSRLEIVQTASGARITHRDETIILRSIDGRPLDVEAVRASIEVSINRSFSAPSQNMIGTAGADMMIGNWGNDTITGEDGSDTLDGGDGSDVIEGNAGDDLIYGRGGDDRLKGGRGLDLILGGTGNDTIEGGSGSDTLQGEAGDDLIYGQGDDDSIEGGDGNDTIQGDLGNDSIFGGAGEDILRGGDGNDLLHGGEDDDRLEGGAGADTLKGDAGKDVLIGDDGADLIFGGADGDVIRGGEGADYLLGQNGDDFIDGQSHDDTILGENGSDTLRGGGGNDFIRGGYHADTIQGDAGNDTLRGESGKDVIDGGDGNDLIYGDTWADTITGGSGDDTLYGNLGHDVINGGDGADLVYGGNDKDTIIGGAGNDTLIGGKHGDSLSGDAGDDVLSGEAGFDTLDGGDGNDSLSGGTYGDTLSGGEGNDTLSGDVGHDLLYGDGGNDVLDGGDGKDRMYGGAGNDMMIGGADRDSMSGGAGNDTLFGDAGFDTLDGGAGNDWLSGGSYGDTLYGGDGSDTLLGEVGHDLLFGGRGADVLEGGAGKDTLIGGAGADTFVFRSGDDADKIRDFHAAEDQLQIDTALNPRGMSAEAFVAAHAAMTDDGIELRFGDGDSILLEGYFDETALADALTFI